MSDEEREEKELDLTSSEVVTKYKSAAEIVNKALQLVLSHCKPKAKIVDLCEKGDAFITEQAGNMYKNVKKKKIERGIAFPTCISVNNTVCHFSPFSSDETVLEDGDVLKIDMGCHIDGFIAVVGHTHVLHEGPVTGRAADVIAAVNTAAEVALRLVRPGKKNKDVTEGIQKVAAAYDCKIVEGVLSHQMKQFVIDGNKVVLSVSNPDTRVDEAEFEENEVYSIDIVASTGEGKPKLLDEKQTTIYKRAVDKNYHLKMKASRFIFSEISQKFPIMPFSGRALEEKRARLGLVECVIHDLLQPYPVLHEKTGDIVAQMKFTVLLMPNGSDRITSHPLQEIQPTKMVVDDPEIKAWLALPTKTKKKGGGKKKKDWWIMASRRALFLKSQSEKAKLAADGSKSRGIHKHDTSNLGAIIDVTSPPRDAPAFSPVAGRNTTDTTSQQTIHETTNASPQPEATPAKKSSARDKGKGAAAETSDALPQRKKRAAADPEHSPKRSKPDKPEPYGEFSQGTSVLQSAAGGVSWTVFKKIARTADMKYMKGLKTQPRMHGLADALMKASQWAMGFGVYAHALETAQEGPVAEVRAELESVQKEAEELKLQKEAAEDTARIAKAKWAEADDSLKKLGDAWERLEAAKTAAEAKAAEAEAERLKAEARAEFEAAENTRLCLELNGHFAVECARRFQASAIYTQLLAAQSETDAEEARHLTVAQLKHKGLLDPAFDENLINLAGDETGQTIELSAEELAAIENAPPIEEDEFFPLLGGADRTPAEADPAQFSNPQEETEPHP